MIAAGSAPLGLLLRHEMRLVWRGSLFGGRYGLWIMLSIALLLHVFGYVVAIGFTRVRLHQADQMLGATLSLMFVGGLMLSQAVQRASELLDDRTDLVWLLSTPMKPRYILTVRLLAVAGAVSLYWLLLLVPLADGMALMGRYDLLGITPMLIVLALLVTSIGFFVTFGLLRVTGVKRTRALANGVATLIGGAVFLGGQTRSLMSPTRSDAFWQSLSPSPEAAAHGILWMPARALLGQASAMLTLLTVAIAAAFLTSWGLQLWFAAGAQAVVAGGISARAGKRADHRAFRPGAWPALLRREILLLRRYPGLAGLALYYLIYLVPAVIAIWHHNGGDAELLGAAPVLSAGELARLFISVTIMGDDAAELTRTAPVADGDIRAAKLCAACLGVLAILGLPMLALGASIPHAVPPMLAGTIGNIACNLLLGLWRPAPIRRSDLRRDRKGWGGLVNVVGFFFSASWSIATWLMVRGSAWSLLPAVLACGTLFLCRPRQPDLM